LKEVLDLGMLSIRFMDLFIILREPSLYSRHLRFKFGIWIRKKFGM